jgi:hypothetical protein
VTDAGKTKVNDGGTMATEFAHLTALYLRRPDGTHFNLPADRGWHLRQRRHARREACPIGVRTA